MKQVERQWLKSISWEQVVSLNRKQCEAQKTTHELRPEPGTQARQLWEKSGPEKMTLPQAVEVCRRCCDLAPFLFNNGNTFAAIANAIPEDWLKLLPPLEAQIARSTIGHFVADHIVNRRELLNVLRHFEARWKINGVEQPLKTPAPVSEMQVEARPSQA